MFLNTCSIRIKRIQQRSWYGFMFWKNFPRRSLWNHEIIKKFIFLFYNKYWILRFSRSHDDESDIEFRNLKMTCLIHSKQFPFYSRQACQNVKKSIFVFSSKSNYHFGIFKFKWKIQNSDFRIRLPPQPQEGKPRRQTNFCASNTRSYISRRVVQESVT